MAYATADAAGPVLVGEQPVPIDDAAERVLADAQAVLDRHSHFTKDPRNKFYCADCVQSNVCQAMTSATAVFARYGRTPRRTRPSRVVRALREAKRSEDAWLS